VKTIMTAALMLLITVPSMAAEIKGSMTCKVKYNTVISVEDGLTNIHSSYRNGLKINANLNYTICLQAISSE